MSTRRLTSAALGAAMVAGLLSCVSERATGTRTDVAGCDVRLPTEAFGSTIVVIRGFAFSPQQVSVKAGGKVTWVNCEPAGTVSHTSTADAGAWSSSPIAPGETFTRTFGTAGALPYHCEPHPSMTGTVTVE